MKARGICVASVAVAIVSTTSCCENTVVDRGRLAGSSQFVDLSRSDIAATYGLRKDGDDAINVAAFKTDAFFESDYDVPLAMVGRARSTCASKDIFSVRDILSIKQDPHGAWSLYLELSAYNKSVKKNDLIVISHNGQYVGLMTAPMAGDGTPDGNPDNYDYYILLRDIAPSADPIKKTFRVEAFPASNWTAKGKCEASTSKCDCERPDIEENFSTALVTGASPIGETHTGEGGEPHH